MSIALYSTIKSHIKSTGSISPSKDKLGEKTEHAFETLWTDPEEEREQGFPLLVMEDQMVHTKLPDEVTEEKVLDRIQAKVLSHAHRPNKTEQTALQDQKTTTIPRREPATRAVFSEGSADGEGSRWLGTASDEGWGSWNLRQRPCQKGCAFV